MPAKLLASQNRAGLVDAWFAASRLWSVAFHFNKGLAGAPETAIAASRETSTNPDMLDAFALGIIAMAGAPAFHGMPESNLVLARFLAGRVQASMKALRVAAPETGAYLNECDYFQDDWRYLRVLGPELSAPRPHSSSAAGDPDGLLPRRPPRRQASEAWSADGFSAEPP